MKQERRVRRERHIFDIRKPWRSSPLQELLLGNEETHMLECGLTEVATFTNVRQQIATGKELHNHAWEGERETSS